MAAVSLGDRFQYYQTFEGPSNLAEVSLTIPAEFSGSHLELPDSVDQVHLTLTPAQRSPVVIGFDRNSGLVHWKWYHVESRDGRSIRGVLGRLSEGTLKSFRDLSL
jgi:hypothetical protein